MRGARRYELCVLLGLLQGCAAGDVAPSAEHERTGAVLGPRCERRLDSVYETLLPAAVETLGNRHVLTLSCDGVHRIYLNPSESFAYSALVGQRLCVRYRYVERREPQVPCVVAPCPDVTERVLDPIAFWPAAESAQEGCRHP